MKKLIYGVLAMGAALAVSFGANVTDASAATASGSAVSYAGMTGDTLYLNANGAKEVLVGTAKVKKKTQLAVSAWDTYIVEDDSVAVDLSKIANTKDAYIQVKADFESDDEASTFVLPASDKIKATYNKVKGYIEVIDAGQKSKPKYANKGLNFYTTNGMNAFEFDEGGNYVETDANGIASFAAISKYKMTGAAVYLQTVTPWGDEDLTASALKISDNAIVRSDGKTAVWAYTLPARASKAVKVTVAKSANAPKLTVDYVNGKITVPKNAMYRIVKDSLGEFTASDKLTLEVKDADVAGKTIDGSTAFAVDVYTKGTDKKPDSKIGHFAFPALTPTAAGSVTYTTTGSTAAGITATFTNNDKLNDYNVTFTVTGKTASTKKIKAGATLTVKKIDLSKAITVKRLGNKTAMTWAGTEITLSGASSSSESGTEATPAPTVAPTYTVENKLANTYTVTYGNSNTTIARNTSASDIAYGTVITVTGGDDPTTIYVVKMVDGSAQYIADFTTADNGSDNVGTYTLDGSDVSIRLTTTDPRV